MNEKFPIKYSWNSKRYLQTSEAFRVYQKSDPTLSKKPET